MRRISIIFCGGCNEYYSRKNIAEQIEKVMLADGWEVVYNSLDAEYLLYLNGCSVSCAYGDSNNNTPYTLVSGLMVDHISTKEKELLDKILKSIDEKTKKK